MALVPGMRLGPYEVTTALGEVYRAHDSRLFGSEAICVQLSPILDGEVYQVADCRPVALGSGQPAEGTHLRDRR